MRRCPPDGARCATSSRRLADAGGRGSLLVNGRTVGTAELPKTWPTVGVTAGLSCGRAGGSPISDAYRVPFPFTGTLHRVVVELADDGEHDLAAEYEGALAEE